MVLAETGRWCTQAGIEPDAAGKWVCPDVVHTTIQVPTPFPKGHQTDVYMGEGAMTRDDIIRLAREAGFGTLADLWPHALERFAALVTAAEREACVKVVELVAREIDDTNGTATYIAKAIRARGNTGIKWEVEP